MRVIAGIYRSRILKSLKGLALRPTSDRLRETLFNVLGSGIQDSRFLDVFAGTGAVGIEALSRGADHVSFIENHAPSAALIRKNLAALKVHSGVTVICADAIRGLEILEAKVKVGDLRLRLHLHRSAIRRHRGLFAGTAKNRRLQSSRAERNRHRRASQDLRSARILRHSQARSPPPPRRRRPELLSPRASRPINLACG